MDHPQTDMMLTPEQAEAVLSEWLGSGVKCTGIERLHGGMINAVLWLHFDRPPFDAVVKLNKGPNGNSFVGERRRLDYLRQKTRLPCPQVYLQDSSCGSIPYDFLLLETLPGVNLGAADLTLRDRVRIDHELAVVLLELHSHMRDTFGDIDGETGKARWTEIFLPEILDMREEVDDRLPPKVLADIDCALEVAEETMSQQGQPTLIHGDIWAANVMVEGKDDGWHLSGLVDPGSHYADVERELAYLQVFNTVTPAFFQRYTSEKPLRPGYEFRRLFYWLHTYMIHVWFFGDRHYHDMTASVAAEIVRRL